MLVRAQLPIQCQPRQNIRFKASPVVSDAVQDAWLQHKETTVDPSIVSIGLFLKLIHRISVQVESSVAPRRLNSSQSGLSTCPVVKCNQRLDINVRNSITIRKTKTIVSHIITDTTQSATGLTQFPSINKRDLPGLIFTLVDLHAVIGIHMKCDIAGSKK